jgi:hypothetical protein
VLGISTVKGHKEEKAKGPKKEVAKKREETPAGH